MEDIFLTIDNSVLDEYNKYYFSIHTKAKNVPIKQPYHPSINEWMIMKRPMMNCLKGKWKDFISWFVCSKGYSNLHIQECELEFITYYGNNRTHDVDNTTPKFIIDGLVVGGMLESDDMNHVKKLILSCGENDGYPRTEIIIHNIVIGEKG